MVIGKGDDRDNMNRPEGNITGYAPPPVYKRIKEV